MAAANPDDTTSRGVQQKAVPGTCSQDKDRSGGVDRSGDGLLLARVAGMHCHRCEQRLRDALHSIGGVREVEVDFPSGQVSVLYDPEAVDVADLTGAIRDAGYSVETFTKREG